MPALAVRSSYNASMLDFRYILLACGLLLASTAASATQDQGGDPDQQLPPKVVQPSAPRPSFDEWLAELRAEAQSRGIRKEVLDTAFAALAPIEQTLKRDRAQAEFTLNVQTYLKQRLTPQTIRTAQQMSERHRDLLARIARDYGVSATIIVAVWGLESNFGRFAGVRPTIPTLATLAYDTRRSAMFRAELLSALEILNAGDIELEKFKGSWAGALGQPQFMPSKYLDFAQDFDGDGRRDIWSSQPDVFASIAYFLQRHGWTTGSTWGSEVKATRAARSTLAATPRREQGCRAQRLMTEAQPLDAWRAAGLRTMSGAPLPGGTRTASLVEAGSRMFLVYENYDALLAYNCAHNYALSVGLLSDRIH